MFEFSNVGISFTGILLWVLHGLQLSCHSFLVFDVMVYLDASMQKLGCWSCMECVQGHLLFIRVIVSSFSGQRVLVPVHVCSTSSGKEVRGSLCQGVALLCGSKPWSHFP